MEQIKEIKIFKLGYKKFEKIVNDTYKQEYEYIADIETSNDTYHMYYDIGKDDLDKWETEDLNEFIRNGRYFYLARTLLIDLEKQNIIPPGDYLISVSW